MNHDPASYDDEQALIRYVWHNHSSLLTHEEKLASKLIQIQTNTLDANGSETTISEWVPTPTTSIKALLSDGMEQFRKVAAKRLISDEQLTIARCPACERVVSTPNAQQCLWCGHDWH